MSTNKTTIRAVQFTAKQIAQLVEVDWNQPPLAPDEIAGKTLATLVSPGTEINHGYLGEVFPYKPGYAAVFEVDKVGSEATDFKRGDRVLCMGASIATTRPG